MRTLSIFLNKGACKVQINILDIGIVPRFIIMCKPAAAGGTTKGPADAIMTIVARSCAKKKQEE
jgi:hypothetical protein